MTIRTTHSGTKQRIAAKLREVYTGEDYQMVCAHCADVGDSGPDWADNIADLVMAELWAERVRPVTVLKTGAELDELPVGSVVMALWDGGPLHYVMQKYAGNGWYGFPSERPLFPLGSGRQGETVALLWRGGDTVEQETP